MLGIFIGVAALIAMVAVGQGANEAVAQQIASLGTNLLIVTPGATTSNGVRAGFGSVSTLTVGDADEIIKNVWPVARVSYLDRQLAQVEYNRQNWSTNVQGVTPSYLPIRNWVVVEGRPLTEEDERSAARVCLLGQTVVANLFGEHSDPVGANIRVKSVDMQVIGVLGAKGQSGWGQDQDDVVLIPFSTAERKVLGVAAPPASSPSGTATPSVANPYKGMPTASSIYTSQISPFGSAPKLTGVVHNIFVQAKSQALIPQAIDQVTDTLHTRHHIQPGQDNDFDVHNLSEVAQAAQGSSQIMALLLATVASISLLVGGIGIMNILLVSVTERTREIGIRMAIGARRVHILLQFLVEAILLGMVGGAGGILAGIGASEAISSIAKWPTLLSPTAIIGGFLFSAAVGIFFGYYPARKASLLNPIDALRYE
jgi:macrolide transport system ATP-binding/permease protein